MTSPVSPRPARSKAPGGSLGRALKGLAGAALAIALWEVLRYLEVIPSAVVPSTFTVVATMVSELLSGELLSPLQETAATWSLGLLATIAVGVPVGVIVGLSRWADAATAYFFDLARPIPAVALVPVAVVLLGLGTGMQVVLIVSAAVWPVLYNTRYAVRNVDPRLIDSGRSVGLSRPSVIAQVILPAALPSILTGLRLSATIALIVTVVTELVASATGLGQFILLTQQAGDSASAMAGVLLASLFGAAIQILAVLVERYAISWQRGLTRAEQ